jgi:gamma-glutamyltranspeptidase/glutathione hydrolase
MTVLRPELTGTLGGVAATHWLASAVGMGVLERGGNAFDAAAAAGFALQIVEPHSNGPGGDVVIAVYSRASDTVRVICGQGPMPRAATIDAFAARGVKQIPAGGLLPATVPGAFGAWMRLLGEYGTMPLESVLEPAIGYASRGYPLLPAAATTIDAMSGLFRTHWSESARVYLPGGAAPARRPRRGRGCATRCWPTPTAGSCVRRRGRRPTARRRSRPRTPPSTRASSPRPSTASPARPTCSTRPAARTAAC